jgi:prephenate dehydratase
LTSARLGSGNASQESEIIRIGYFGPEGTFTHEALLAAQEGMAEAGREAAAESVPFPTIYETVMAVQAGRLERALVPIENSLEGAVNITLDTLAIDAPEVRIVGEFVHPIHHSLVARTALALDEIEVVVSHPQATAQCARFIRSELPAARVLAGGSTVDAVRMVAEHDGPWAALGTRLAAQRHGLSVLRTEVEDAPENETRFVWLAGGENAPAPDATATAWKTSIVFWGQGSDAPGWLVRCLAEFADRGVNLTRIESRPRKLGLGNYMFFLDFEGRAVEPRVSAALDGVRSHVEALRILGSFPVG